MHMLRAMIMGLRRRGGCNAWVQRMVRSHGIKVACFGFTGGSIEANIRLRLRNLGLQRRRDALPVRQMGRRDHSGDHSGWWENLSALAAACLGNSKTWSVFVAER